MAFSPDGRTIAAGFQATGKGEGGGVVLWDAAAQNRLVDKPLPVKASWVNSMAFSPDGETIAVGFRLLDRGGVVLWDSVAQTPGRQTASGGRRVHSVAFSPDGKTIAAGFSSQSEGGGVVLWDAGRAQTPGRQTASGGRRGSQRGLQPRRQDHRGRIWPARRRRLGWRRGAVGRGRAQAPGRQTTFRGEGLG